MSLILPTLLCLELILGQSIQAQKGGLPQPNITAHPRSIVPYGKHVTIQCWGPAEAGAYKIFKEGGPEPKEAKISTLYIQIIELDWTGLYHCSYKSGELWSPHSAPLPVVLTGAFKKPSLSSMSGTVVASGDKVTLKCFLKLKFDRFILIKEDEFHTIQNQSATCQDSQCQAIFNRGPVNATQAGTYRCYGAFNNDPYVWSSPSDPLELEVKELPDSSTRPTDLGPTQASHAQDYTVGNLIRMGVAALVLVVLGVLLFQARDSERSVSNAARTCAQRGQGTVQNVGAVEPI